MLLQAGPSVWFSVSEGEENLPPPQEKPLQDPCPDRDSHPWVMQTHGPCLFTIPTPAHAGSSSANSLTWQQPLGGAGVPMAAGSARACCRVLPSGQMCPRAP